MTNKEIEEKIQSNSLVRIANAIEEILRMVKADQDISKNKIEVSRIKEELEQLQTHMDNATDPMHTTS